MITAHADGSCLGNPGPGGWAVVIVETDGAARSLTGSAPDTTNNRMELTAALAALRALPADVPSVLFCDSEYVVKGLTAWLPGWQGRGWKTAQGKPVANPDLWQELGAAKAARPCTQVRWVRGHDGDAMNETADRLARAEAEKAKLRLRRAVASPQAPAPFGRVVSAAR
ncbi:ribonuclease HI [Xanthobacter oligotrophicus]|uniref:ribonuclease HI n=1 Tax=Xanthobacter oligotrophicus TaxID=2607286 RepID=UPI0011F34F8F|nr:ribonuclease HI [Xanthobacter oligotrophicus]MCG5236123.1 ribonuclease HI [Xanthobacter oligotrophicus]